jgi:hypothetical protein
VEQVRPSIRKAEKKVTMEIRGEKVTIDVRGEMVTMDVRGEKVTIDKRGKKVNKDIGKKRILWAPGSLGAAFWNSSEHDDVDPCYLRYLIVQCVSGERWTRRAEMLRIVHKEHNVVRKFIAIYAMLTLSGEINPMNSLDIDFASVSHHHPDTLRG